MFQPFFLDGPAGPLFAVYFPPAPGIEEHGDVVYIPPFAEEMNQSRRMVTLQARRLAERGVGVLLLDLFGTGDSGGNFSDARWDIWLADIGAAIDWLDHRGRRLLGLWGLRLGGALAMSSARRHPDRVKQIVLWQPVTLGRRMLDQFLRTRVAAAMGQDRRGETVRGLRDILQQDGTLEVAGYHIVQPLAEAIDAVDLANLSPGPGCRVDWCELVPQAEAAPSPATTKTAAAWRASGASLELHTVVGPPFWALQVWTDEAVLVPALWDTTVSLWAEPR